MFLTSTRTLCLLNYIKNITDSIHNWKERGGETKREKEKELMENLQELTGSLGSLANCDLEEGRHHTLLIIRR
jgi:hypothetical protein